MALQKYFLSTAFILISCSAVTYACHGQLLKSGIQEPEKQIILKEHNRLRQVVATGRYPGQPGAENMREIVWDDELAARAQKWADNCQFRHDPQRTINRFTMGQNLAIIWSTAPLEADDGDFPSRIQSWFNEVQKYSFGDAWSPKTGHYSQLVWGETSLVGCGYSEYKDTSKYNKLYVCNYGPGGNVVGYNPYEVGKPSCGTYGMRPSSQYQGLCAAPQAATSTATSVNSISSNTIETYDFQQTKSFNIKQSTFATQFVQQASSSSSYPKQATSTLAQTISAAASAAAASAGLPVGVSNSFGTATRGSSTSHTTETNQYTQYTQYKNKLEAYKPSAVEFQNSVRKHTILRTYLNQPQKPLKTQRDQNQKQAQKQQQYQQHVNTPKPATRGWSLLTWRG